MIKISELRIGNIARVANLTGRVTGLDMDSGANDITMSFSPGYEYPPEAVDPIPLTPEIMEKCGFARDEENDCNGYSSYRPETAHYGVRLFINDKRHVCAHYLGTAISTNHPQYLHQLQNLFFALTGEELTVNL